MKKTNVYLFRDNLASYLEEVEKTQIPLVVYKFKKPIAVIIPPKKEFLNANIDDYFGFMGKGETGEKFVNRVRRNKNEKKYITNLKKGKV
jgi:hypothetical protein